MKTRGRKAAPVNAARTKGVLRQIANRFSLEQGTDFKLKSTYNDGTISIIDVIALTTEAKKAMPANETVLAELGKSIRGSIGAPEITKTGLRIRYVAKASRGPNASNKKVVRKLGHLKVAGNGKGRKRLPELRLPWSMGRKPHVKVVFDFLNSKLFTDTMRAEIVEVIAKFATNTSSCKKYEDLLAKLEGKIILDPKTNKRISESIFEKLKEHSIKLVKTHRKPRKHGKRRAPSA